MRAEGCAEHSMTSDRITCIISMLMVMASPALGQAQSASNTSDTTTIGSHGFDLPMAW
jgi:hypothetical protein